MAPQITETMEFEFPLPSTLVILVLPFLLMLLRLRPIRNRSSIPIPGPTKLPIIGNIHNIAGDSRPPHQIFKDLAAKHGPLLHLQLGEVPFIIASSVEVAKQLLKTHDLEFANRPPGYAATPITYNYTNICFAPYGDYWRRLRRISTLELFSARRVKSFRHVREEENLKLAKWIASSSGSPMDLSEKVYLSSFDVVTRSSIGSSIDERRKITEAVKQVVQIGSGLSIADLYPSIKFLPYVTGLMARIDRTFRQLDTVLDRILDQHRANKKDDDAMETDLVDVLLKYQGEGVELPLTNDNIKAVVLDMFTAGGETSATVVEWAMSEMTKNPTTLKRAQEEVRKVFDGKGFVDEEKINEVEYLKLVIKETLRLHPPAPLLVPRYRQERFEMNGYEVPAKSTVLVNAWAMGRDPEYWKEPLKFTPERFMESSSAVDFKGNDLEFIPFGAGRRMCPGMNFGTASVEFTLCILLYHFDWEMLPGVQNEDLDMAEDIGLTLKRKHHLYLIPTLRRPLAA